MVECKQKDFKYVNHGKKRQREVMRQFKSEVTYDDNSTKTFLKAVIFEENLPDSELEQLITSVRMSELDSEVVQFAVDYAQKKLAYLTAEETAQLKGTLTPPSPVYQRLIQE